MFPILTNTTPFLFIITATLGVLVHDTQIDRATTVALAAPAAFATFAAVDVLTKSTDHIHTERASMPKHLASIRATLPRIQPRDDDRRYVQSKKLQFTTGGNNYIWPSI